MVIPYLPDIMEGIVERVDASFSVRALDPFNVFFDKGTTAQVKKSVVKADQNFPLVWLAYKYAEDFNRKKNGVGVFSTANFQVIIAMPTEKSYTQQQREDLIFKARLDPIYEMLKFEMSREKWFQYNGKAGPDHTKLITPYWGMGEPNGTDANNLFMNTAYDAINIYYKDVKILERECAPTGGYEVANPNIYPPSMGVLTFFDDLELIVDGPLETDPVHEASSVIIPSLIGRDFEVQQRAIGQLRKRVNVEFIPDEVNGGFALQGGLKFYKGDTYIVKIRPAYLS